METIFCFDICASIIVFMIIVAQVVRKMTKGRTNIFFLCLSASILLTSIFNMWDAIYGTIIAPSAYNLYLRYAINYVYFFVRNSAAPFFVLFISNYLGVWNKAKQKKLYKYAAVIPWIVFLIFLITNPFTKAMFYFDENMNYCRGSLIIINYVIAFYYLIVGAGVIFRFRYLLSNLKFGVLFFFLPIVSMSAVVQLFYANVKVENFATAIALLVLVIEVERPEEIIDYVVGTENYTSFVNRMGKIYKTGDFKCLLLVKFVNNKILRNNIGQDMYIELLKDIAKKSYEICRIMKGGDQIYYLDQGTFAILGDVSKYDEFLDIGRVMGAYMQENFKLGQLEVALDPRICLIKIPDEMPDYESLLNFATTFDEKMPKSRSVMALTTVADSKEFIIRNDISAIINRGIANYNFQMYYQPIYSIEKGKFVSAEALIRLEDEKYGFVSPALFIPEAEKSGAIHQIGDFVLEDVCRFIGSNDFESLGLEYIEINLSVAQCIESNLFEKIDGLMKKYGVRPDQINLEITETGVNYDPVTTDRNIEMLNKAGITFSLDDYGTGYSSIKRVVTLPLNIVKLDKSLVDDMDLPLMWTVITNTVRMLKRMNKKILVEGVETKRALDKFEELGCDYIQGYYFSKPLNESSFLKFVISKNFGVEI